MKYQLFVLFNCLFIYVVCYKKGENDLKALPTFPKAKWTLGVYMNGDNNLEASITGGPTPPDERRGKTIETYIAPGDFHFELADLGSTADVHVVALIDRTPGYSDAMDNWNNSRLYYVEKDDYPDNSRGTYWINKTDDEMNMASPSTMAWFLNTLQTNFPSDYTWISIYDHNWAWHEGWFQEDETSNSDTMDYAQLLSALQATNNTKFNVVSYDACVSSHIEVLHTWRPYTEVFSGSQDYVGWGGIDYAQVLSLLEKNSSMTPEDLGIDIAQSMLSDVDDHCSSSIRLNDGTFDEIVHQVNHLAQLFIKHFDIIHNDLISIRKQSPQVPNTIDDDMHRDLYGIAQATVDLFVKREGYEDIINCANEIMKSIKSAVIFNYVAKEHKSCLGGNGLSIYWPRPKTFQGSDEADYRRTSFAISTEWDEFLKMF